MRKLPRILTLGALVALLSLPAVSSSDYMLTLTVEAMIFGIFASGIHVLLGYTGLVSLGSAMFLGLGGYGLAILCTLLGLPLWVGVPGTLALVALISVAIGAVCIRTSGIQFLLVTLAFSQMLYGGAIKLAWTNGSDGMSGIPRPELLGLSGDDPVVFFYYVVLALVLTVWLLARIVRSPFGSVLIAIRENERRAMAMGYPVTRYKLGAFVLSSVICAVAGILQAQQTYFINPDSMSWQISGEGVLMVIIGGAGTLFGPIVGSALFVMVKHLLSVITDEYMLFFGVFFMLVVALFRGGVFGLVNRWLERSK